MKKTVNFKKHTEDVFPFVESAIRIFDDNLKWWKANWDLVDEYLYAEISKVVKGKEVDVTVKLVFYNGPDERVTDIERSEPAIKYTLSNVTPEEFESISDNIGDEWNGHTVFTHDDDIIIFFE